MYTNCKYIIITIISSPYRADNLGNTSLGNVIICHMIRIDIMEIQAGFGS